MQRILEKLPNYLLGLTIILAFLLTAQSAKAAAFNDAASGNWNIGTTWGGACASACVEGTDYPGASDDATIDSHTVTLSAAHSVNNITISGGTLDLSTTNYTLTVYGNWAKTSGTFTERSGTIDFALASGTQTLNSGGTGSTSNFYHLTHSGAGTLQLITNAILISGNFTNSAGTFDANSLDITCAGNWTNSATFTAGAGTVNWSMVDSGIAYTLTGATTFYNLTFSDNGGFTSTQNISDDIIVQNNLSITRTFGNFTRIFADGSETHTISVAGNVTNSGNVYMEADLTIVMNGTTTQSVTTSSTGKIGSLQISNTSATVSLGSNLLVAGNLTIDLNTTLDVTATNYNITFGRSWTRNGTFTQRQGTVNWSMVDSGIAYTLTGATTFYNLTFSDNGGFTSTQNISDDIIVQNNLSITRTFGNFTRIFADGSETHTISVAGNVTNSGNVYMEADLTIVMNGTTTQSVTTSSTGTLGDLQISNTVGEVQLGATLLVADDITVDANTIFDLVSYGITGAAGTVFTNNGTIQLQGDQTFTNATPTNATGSTVEYTATSSSRAIKNWSYVSLKINGTGGSFTMAAGETLTENLTVTAGTLDVSDQTLSINGNTTINGGTMMTGTNTVTFGDAAGDTVTISSGELQIESDSTTADIVKNAGTWTNSGGTITYKAGTSVSTTLLSALSPYYNLTVNSSGSTYTLNGAIDVNANLTITAGTLDVGSGLNYQINVAGNWSNSGTFTAQSGTVVFDGTNQTLTGSTTFYNFYKQDATNNATDLTLTFDNTATQTISGLITLDGLDSDDRVNLVSNSPGTQWSLIANGTFAIDYVDVKDSDASSGLTIQHTNTISSGNNLNWFPASYLKITGTATMTAGGTNELTITAYTVAGAVADEYTGSKSLTFSGLANAPSGNVPTVEGTNLGTATSVAFTSGVSNSNVATLIAYKAESASLDVTDGTVSSTGDPSYDLDLTVNAGTKNKLLWVTQPSSSVTAGATWTTFTIEITDQYENRTSDTDNITVAPSAGAFAGTTTKAAASGLATFNDISYNTATTITVTGSATGLTSTPASSSVVVNPASANYLKITGTASMTAGGTNTITITTYDAYNNIATGYTGDKSLTFSGANPSPNNTNPTCRDKNNQDVNFGTTTTVTFSSAVGTCVMKLYESGFPAVDVTNGTISSFGSEDYDLNANVAADDLSNFLVNAPATANSGTAFSTTITSRDQYNNTTSSVSGSTALSVDQSATVSPSSIAASEFTDDGIYTGNLTISNITEQPSITLTATNGSSTGSDTITVSGIPAAPTIGTGQSLSSTSIRWNFFDNSSYETGFKLYDNTDTEIVSSSNTNLTYLDETNLTPNTQYSGRYVKAFNAIGNSAASSAVTAIYTLVNIPTTLTTVADSTTQITLSWSVNSNPSGTGYYAENTTSNTNSGWLTDTSAIFTGLTCATSYSFKVKARNGDGTETSFTDITTATTQSCPVTGGGGGLPPTVYNLPSQPQPSPENPQGELRILINNDAQYTESREVILQLFAGDNVKRMAISNSPDFSTSTGQIPYQETYQWDLCQNQQECPAGEYTIFTKFYTQYGVASEVVSDSIVYRKEKPIIKLPEIIIKKIPEIIKKIPEIFKPKPPEEVKPPEVPIEELVLEEAPLVFQGQWQLLASEPIKRFVLSPLPKEIRVLAEKFPELEKTFEQVGITKITDIKKLRAIKLTLPPITEKEEIPTDIVFAKTGAEKIDLSITLSLDEKGKLEQRIQTISNKPLQLAVKPDKPVESVKGYVVFKSRIMNQESRIMNQNSTAIIHDSKFMIQNLTASLFFAWPSFAKEYNPTEIETRLVLLEFEYTDPDNDGIYTAEIQSPIVEGEYEIITVMDFEDPELGMKEIRLITVVDPEGYIYSQLAEGKMRIAGAIVFLFWLNPKAKQYELWPAKEYQQGNPQVTDDTGKYSFLVPPGMYYLKVEAPKYPVYQSNTFSVKEGSGIHMNIELKTKYWWLKAFGWQSIIITILILIIIFLAYNFYRDKMRDRIKNYESRIKKD